MGFIRHSWLLTKQVLSQRAGDEQAWRWLSDGTGEFTIAEGNRDGRGTTIRLKMRKTDEEYLDNSRLRQIIKTYSDHIALPIVMTGDDGEETVNEASALWTRQKKNVTKEQYTEFYRHVGGSTSLG